MSIFGEPLPHEDDTATSLIRREGFPPLASYDQMPVFYVCPCCSEINPSHGRNNLLRTMKQEKEMERQRIMQLNVFEERAKPIYNTVPRPRCTNIHREPEDEELNQPAVPEPPMTLDELRRARRETNKTRLIVTVHHGKGINVDPRDPVSVLVRCGAFEGQTAKVPRGRNAICTWEELFEFPYPSEEEHLEVLVVDDTLPPEDDHLFGGIVIPPHALRNRARGDEETLPVCPESEMHRSYGRMKETPMGSLVVSWYVKHDGEDDTEGADARQNLEGGPIDCSFVVHRLFQYTDTGAEPYEGGVLCLLRDTDDNCSESTLFIKLGHVLICITKGEVENEEDEELIVVGAVPLDFEKLYHRGSAVLLVESKVKEDVLWGEIALEWGIVPHSLVQRENEESRQATQISSERAARRSVSGPRESLFLTVMRGINLTNHFGEPLSQGQVSVFACDMEGSTYTVAAEEAEDGETRVITWNQEVRFIEMDGGQSVIDVQVLHDKQAVSSGRFELQGDNDVLTVKMHDLYDENVDRGEILVSYKLIRSPEDENSKRRSAVSQGSRGEEYLSNAEEGSTDREGGRRSGKRRGRGKDSEGRSEDSEDERDEVDYDDEKGVSGASDVSREDGHKGGDFGSRKRGGSSKKRSAQVSPKTDDDAEPCYESDAPVPAKHAGSSSRKGKKSKKSKDVSPKRSPKDHTDGEDEAGAPISKRSKQISPMSGDEQDASSPPKHDGSSSRKGKKSKKSKDVSPKRSPESHTDGEDEAGAPISKRSKQISPMSGDEQDASSPPKHEGSSSRKGKKSKKSKDVSPKRSPKDHTDEDEAGVPSQYVEDECYRDVDVKGVDESPLENDGVEDCHVEDEREDDELNDMGADAHYDEDEQMPDDGQGEDNEVHRDEDEFEADEAEQGEDGEVHRDEDEDVADEAEQGEDGEVHPDEDEDVADEAEQGEDNEVHRDEDEFEADEAEQGEDGEVHPDEDEDVADEAEQGEDNEVHRDEDEEGDGAEDYHDGDEQGDEDGHEAREEEHDDEADEYHGADDQGANDNMQDDDVEVHRNEGDSDEDANEDDVTKGHREYDDGAGDGVKRGKGPASKKSKKPPPKAKESAEPTEKKVTSAPAKSVKKPTAKETKSPDGTRKSEGADAPVKKSVQSTSKAEKPSEKAGGEQRRSVKLDVPTSEDEGRPDQPSKVDKAKVQKVKQPDAAKGPRGSSVKKAPAKESGDAAAEDAAANPQRPAKAVREGHGGATKSQAAAPERTSGKSTSSHNKEPRKHGESGAMPRFHTKNSKTEDHIPLEKRASFRSITDNIKQLEKLSRESERGSVHHSSNRGTSPLGSSSGAVM
uniref:C2 domain-containing protein n=1 Tax=Trypanosoma vivax (strain Y486) TaxID=1055687 RepID=G0TYG3_TRYVY|nr:conserved hypothetical protein, fragment [Trypanosoma vivax Y486]